MSNTPGEPRPASLSSAHAAPYGQGPSRATTGFEFVTAEEVERLQARVLELEAANRTLCTGWAEDHTHVQDLCVAAGIDRDRTEGNPDFAPGIQDLAAMLVEHYERQLNDRDNQYLEAVFNQSLKVDDRVRELEEGLAQAVHYLTYDGHPEGQPGNPGWKLRKLLPASSEPADPWDLVRELKVQSHPNDGSMVILDRAGRNVHQFHPRDQGGRFWPFDQDSWHTFRYADRLWDGHWMKEDGQAEFEVFGMVEDGQGQWNADLNKSVLLEIV